MTPIRPDPWPDLRSSERGLTLPEIMVVVVLAGIVTLGLVGFYLTSQATWIDASTQAMVQRDATTLIEGITRETRRAGDVIILPVPPDSTNSILVLYDRGFVTEQRRFSWDAVDSLVKVGLGVVDEGPVVSSRVDRFHAALDDSLPLVHIDIWLRGPTGDVTKMATAIRMYNADTP